MIRSLSSRRRRGGADRPRGGAAVQRKRRGTWRKKRPRGPVASDARAGLGARGGLRQEDSAGNARGRTLRAQREGAGRAYRRRGRVTRFQIFNRRSLAGCASFPLTRCAAEPESAPKTLPANPAFPCVEAVRSASSEEPSPAAVRRGACPPQHVVPAAAMNREAMRVHSKAPLQGEPQCAACGSEPFPARPGPSRSPSRPRLGAKPVSAGTRARARLLPSRPGLGLSRDPDSPSLFALTAREVFLRHTYCSPQRYAHT